MASLTPQSRKGEVVEHAYNEGLVNGGMVLAPALAGLYFAMKNPTFRKVTNWQSRTAIVIMPALFAFGFTAEDRMVHRMREVAEETDHSIRTIEWAERKRQTTKDVKLHDLYKQSILDTNVRLVEGGELTTFQKAANYVQANPFKVIAGFGVPAVGLIFYGQGPSEQLSMKILHTRVLGQFTVICTLLGVMGMKEIMDSQGRYITEDEVEERVAEMTKTRQELLQRLTKEAEARAHLADHTHHAHQN